MHLFLVLLTGCLINRELYEERLEALTDHDGDGQSASNGDCDDSDASVYAGAPEHCDGVDQDCDGEVDEDPEGGTWYLDADGDGFGGGEPGCKTAQRAEIAGDCDDLSPDVHPGATETCDGRDEDCDDAVDEDATEAVETWPDLDGDGQGDDNAEIIVACLPAADRVAVAGDCVDTDARIYTGAPEHIDGVANDCAFPGDIDDLLADDADVTLSGMTDADRAGAIFAAPGDTDGDGVDDLVVGAPGAGRVYVVRAFGSGSLGDTPLAITEWDGRAMVAAGFQGDGSVGVALTAEDGVALIDAAGSGGTRAVASVGGAPPSSLAVLVGSITPLLAGGGAGVAWIFLDGLESVTEDAPVWITGLTGEVTVADAGDLDGDGLSELAVGAPDVATVYVFGPYAGAFGPEAADVILQGPTGSELGAALASAGDHDGDGVGDLVLGAPGYADTGVDEGRAYVVYGPSGTSDVAAAGSTIVARGAGARLGAAVTGGVDVDGDGLDDVVVSAPSAVSDGTQDAGMVLMYLGSHTGSLTYADAAAQIGGVSEAGVFGTAVLLADLDGDTHGDLVVGGEQHAAGAAHLYFTAY